MVLGHKLAWLSCAHRQRADRVAPELRLLLGIGNRLVRLRTSDNQHITFAEWGYLGKGKFQRRDFRLDFLTQMSGFIATSPLFAHLGKHEVFTPTRTYPPMTVGELAVATLGDRPKEVA